MTMEQTRIQARLMHRGVAIHTASQITGVQSDINGGLQVHASSIYTATADTWHCRSLLLVTMRDPDDALHQALLGHQADWHGAGIRSVDCIGDALAPGTVAAAVYAGHRAARELDAPCADADGVTFRREMIAISQSS